MALQANSPANSPAVSPAVSSARIPGWTRVALVLLGLPNLLTGAWAIVAPQSWYDNFPGWSPQLISAYPPFNEHLATDAGAGLFAAGLLALVAAAWTRRDVVIVAMIGVLAFILPHTLFHLFNPSDALTASEDIQSTAALGISVGLALLVLGTAYQQSLDQDVT